MSVPKGTLGNGKTFSVTRIELLMLLRTDIKYVKSSSNLLLSLNPVFCLSVDKSCTMLYIRSSDLPAHCFHGTIISFKVSFWSH